MNIDLTEKEVEFLKQYAGVYIKERKVDGTADPIVLVQTRIEEPTSSKYGYDGTKYNLNINHYPVTEDSLLDSIEEIKNVIYDYFEDGLENYDIQGYTKEDFKSALDDLIDEIDNFLDDAYDLSYTAEDDNFDICIEVDPCYYKYKYETVAYFFTRKEAEKYIEYQGHNLNHPRVYTDYAGYKNFGDYPVFQKLLLKMGEELNKEEEQCK